MTFIDMEITRRQFVARYRNLGRTQLPALADAYGLDMDVAEHWADQADREAEQQIAAVRPPVAAGGGIEGAVALYAAPSSLSHSAAATLTFPGGAFLTGAACTAAPGFSSDPVGSRRGSGAAAAPSHAVASDNFQGDRA